MFISLDMQKSLEADWNEFTKQLHFLMHHNLKAACGNVYSTLLKDQICSFTIQQHVSILDSSSTAGMCFQIHLQKREVEVWASAEQKYKKDRLQEAFLALGSCVVVSRERGMSQNQL